MSEGKGIQWTDETSLYYQLQSVQSRTACNSGAGVKGDVCRKTASQLGHQESIEADLPKGDKIINSLFPRLVVISRSSSLPTCTKSLSAKSSPTSSHVSLKAVYSALSSVGSCLPPGKAICDAHRLPPLPVCPARRMKSNSGTVRG